MTWRDFWWFTAGFSLGLITFGVMILQVIERLAEMAVTPV